MTGDATRVMRRLIVNADDLGQSEGINAGIADAVEHGIVTSASMMVRWSAAADAALWARGRSDVSIGLHVDVGEWVHTDEGWEPLYEVVDTDDEAAVRDELQGQLQRFTELMGRPPTHLDSHQHAHLGQPLRGAVCDAARALGVPVRRITTDAAYCGDFYGQWGSGQPLPDAITVDSLIAIFDRLPEGTTELACHPAIDDLHDLESMYLTERGRERRTLCDPLTRRALEDRRISLCSFGGRL